MTPEQIDAEARAIADEIEYTLNNTVMFGSGHLFNWIGRCMALDLAITSCPDLGDYGKISRYTPLRVFLCTLMELWVAAERSNYHYIGTRGLDKWQYADQLAQSVRALLETWVRHQPAGER